MFAQKTEKKADAPEDDKDREGEDPSSSGGDPASADEEDPHVEEQPPPPAMSSWSSDHNYNAVTPEKTAPVAPSVLNKACMYLFEGLPHLIYPPFLLHYWCLSLKGEASNP